MKQKHSLRVSFAYCLSGEPRRIFHAITVSLASLPSQETERRFSDGSGAIVSVMGGWG